MMHVMVDEPDAAQDRIIAEHIVSVHREKAAVFERVPYKMEDMQRYIKYARSIKPELTDKVRPRRRPGSASYATLALSHGKCTMHGDGGQLVAH